MSESAVTRTVTLDSREEAVLLFGPRDQYLRTVRDALNVKVVARGDLILLEAGTAEPVTAAAGDGEGGASRPRRRRGGRGRGGAGESGASAAAE